jgi:EAL domain-containing protein (putative c-di-GMP-specific phosphodiesterase class I)
MTIAPDQRPSVETVIEDELVRTVFQPIVRLADGQVVGHEALARGPRDTPLESPAALFSAAQAAGLTAELDKLCMRTAFTGAEQAGLRTLFINAEPSTFSGPVPRPGHQMQVVVEVTERDVVLRPADLLDALERARDDGWAVAVDDVGVDWRSLAMLPVIAPEIVKLDRSVLAAGPIEESGRVLRACRAHIDRRAGMLVAEGIEDDDHAQLAIGFGAALGQGYHFGRPAAEPLSVSASLSFDTPWVRTDRHVTPFELVKRESVPTAVTTKRHLLPFSRDIEIDASSHRDPHILLATFQAAELFTAETQARYARIAEGLAFVAIYGAGIGSEPAAGVVGTSLSDGEPLCEEWDVVSVGPHQSSALIARDLGDRGPDLDRRFEYVLLSDRGIIERAARSLMLRITAARASQRV